jgi:hypothetical protein
MPKTSINEASRQAMLARYQGMLLIGAWLGKAHNVSFAQGAINALKWVNESSSADFAATTDALAGGYHPPACLQAAWACLPVGLESFSLAQVQQFLTAQGVEMADQYSATSLKTEAELKPLFQNPEPAHAVAHTRPQHARLWPIVGVIALATMAVGNELESQWLMVLPMWLILFFGLTQEWVYAEIDKQEAQDIEQAAQQARAAVVAGELGPRNEPGLQGVIDPLPHADDEPAQAQQKTRLVVHPLEVHRERGHQAGGADYGANLVPGVDLEGLQRVRHGREHSNTSQRLFGGAVKPLATSPTVVDTKTSTGRPIGWIVAAALFAQLILAIIVLARTHA